MYSPGVVAAFRVDSSGTGGAGPRLGAARAAGGDTLLVGNAPGAAVTVTAFDDLTGRAGALPPQTRGRAYGIFVG